MEGHEKPKTWRVISHYRYADRPLKPHSVMSCISGVRPTDTNRGLSTHELRAIVCTMLLRVNHKPFRTCRTHPVSVSTTCHSVVISKTCTDSGSLFLGWSTGEGHSGVVWWKGDDLTILTNMELCRCRESTSGIVPSLSFEWASWWYLHFVYQIKTYFATLLNLN